MVMERWHSNEAFVYKYVFHLFFQACTTVFSVINEHVMFGVERSDAFQQALEYGAFYALEGYEIWVFYPFVKRWTKGLACVLIKR
jgi:hypothetical protein